MGKKKDKKKKRGKALVEPLVEEVTKEAESAKKKGKPAGRDDAASGDERLALLGRVLDYVLDKGMLDDDVVERWGRKCLSKGELAALGLDTESDKLPPAKPIKLRTDLFGGKAPKKK